MHVLGLVNMRESEMRLPFEQWGEQGTLVTVDPSLRNYLSALRTGASHVKRHDSDAILVYNGTGLIGGVGVLLSLYFNVPLLIRVNGDVYRQHREEVAYHWRQSNWKKLALWGPYLVLTRLIFRAADGFVPVSESLVDILHRQTGCPKNHIAAAPNPVRLDEYRVSSPEPSTDHRADGKLVLTVTNLDFRGKWRGAARAVDELVPVLGEYSDVEYAIAGDGKYSDQLVRYVEERIKDDDVRERVHLLGFVESIADLYAAADVFVYLSTIDGYPNVVLEAKAAELPIVTNPAYGITEQIDAEESGLFVDPGVDGEIRRAVTRLLEDTDERARLGRNARRSVETENEPGTVSRQLFDAVQTVVCNQEAAEVAEVTRSSSPK